MQNIAHTGANYCNILLKVLDLLYCWWKPKLCAISTDGVPCIDGCIFRNQYTTERLVKERECRRFHTDDMVLSPST